MTRVIYYRYLGTNGIIESPVHLEGTYFVRLVDLTADKNMVLTDGKTKVHHVRCSEEDEKNWKEVKA